MYFQKHLIGLLEEPDLSDSNDNCMMDLPQLEPSPCSDHEAVLSVGTYVYLFLHPLHDFVCDSNHYNYCLYHHNVMLMLVCCG